MAPAGLAYRPVSVMKSAAEGSVSHDRSRAFPVVITEDDRLARGDALLSKRHNERAELGIGAVENRLPGSGQPGRERRRSSSQF